MKPTSHYEYPEDIARALCAAVGMTEESEIKDCTDALYQLKAIAQNEYNSDFYRTFYAALSKLTEGQSCTP